VGGAALDQLARLLLHVNEAVPDVERSLVQAYVMVKRVPVIPA